MSSYWPFLVIFHTIPESVLSALDKILGSKWYDLNHKSRFLLIFPMNFFSLWLHKYITKVMLVPGFKTENKWLLWYHNGRKILLRIVGIKTSDGQWALYIVIMYAWLEMAISMCPNRYKSFFILIFGCHIQAFKRCV